MRAQPIAYSEREGGPQRAWPLKAALPLDAELLRLRSDPNPGYVEIGGLMVHAIFFANGEVWNVEHGYHNELDTPGTIVRRHVPRTVARSATEAAALSDALDARPGGIARGAREDAWAHRSARMKCSTCMWWLAKLPEPGSDPAVRLLGRCRRHAPRPEGGGWPATYDTDWCGDHKLDEAKA